MFTFKLWDIPNNTRASFNCANNKPTITNNKKKPS